MGVASVKEKHQQMPSASSSWEPAEWSGVEERTARRKLRGGQVVQAAVRPRCIVLGAPALEQVACFDKAGEELAVQQFAEQTRVEGFDESVLLGGAGADEERRHADACKPAPDRLRDKLWSVVRTDALRHASLDHDRREHAGHLFGRDRPRRVKARALARVLADDCQDFTRRLFSVCSERKPYDQT